MPSMVAGTAVSELGGSGVQPLWSMLMFVVIACFAAVIAPFVHAETRTLDGSAELKGTWKLVSIERGGEKTEFTEGQPRWVIRGDMVQYGGVDLAKLAVDSMTTPKVLDLRFLD